MPEGEGCIRRGSSCWTHFFCGSPVNTTNKLSLCGQGLSCGRNERKNYARTNINNNFNFRRRAALTALCLVQCLKYSYSLVGAMRSTPTAVVREVSMKPRRRYAFHADRIVFEICVKYSCGLVGAVRFKPTAAYRTVFDAMREVFMQSCRRWYVLHANCRTEGFSFSSQVLVIIALCTATPQAKLRVSFFS